MALLVEHDLIDYVNAGSTVAIAAFTAMMYFVVKYQLRVSKDIERAWVMPKLTKDPMALLLCENTSIRGTQKSVTTTASLLLVLKNDGEGPVWVRQLLARLVLVDSLDQLPKTPELGKEDDQHWHPPPFVDTDSVRFRITANGSQVANEKVVAYGKITYLDKFREERFSTFGYFIESGGSRVERLEAHPEYNRNT